MEGEENQIVNKMTGGKRQLPKSMELRVELNKKLAKDTNHKGMWIPIIKTVTWIVKKSKSSDSIEKVKEAMKYYENHKKECIDKYKEFNDEYEKNKRNKKSKVKNSRSKNSKSKKGSKKSKKMHGGDDDVEESKEDKKKDVEIKKPEEKLKGGNDINDIIEDEKDFVKKYRGIKSLNASKFTGGCDCEKKLVGGVCKSKQKEVMGKRTSKGKKSSKKSRGNTKVKRTSRRKSAKSSKRKSSKKK